MESEDVHEDHFQRFKEESMLLAGLSAKDSSHSPPAKQRKAVRNYKYQVSDELDPEMKV